MSDKSTQSTQDEPQPVQAPFDISKLALVARETSDSVIITDCKFVVLWTNAAAQRITGYCEEEMLGRNLLEIAKADTSSPEVAAQMAKELSAGRRFAAVAWTVRKNGEPLLADFEVIPYCGASGTVEAYIGITRDVTGKAIAERALRASEEHLRNAQKLAGFGSWRFLIDKNEILWSEELYRAFGRDMADGPPTLDEFYGYMDPSDRVHHRGLVARAMQTGMPYEVTYSITRRDGTKRQMAGRGDTRRDTSGRVVELYGTTQDITARVLAEKERLELQARLAGGQRLESLSRLAGGIAHDFNNLLMGVMMAASLLEREVGPHSRAAEAVASVRHAALRMAERTNQLLTYAGQGRFVSEHIDPNFVATNELDSLQPTLPPEAELETHITNAPATVEMDSNQLRGALMNLLSNAVDALEGRLGKITVRTHVDSSFPDATMWVLEVTDSGVGMTQEVQQRVFEPFFTTKELGRGLGLSTVHGIVQRSGGTIEIRSVPKEGTTFTIRLPIAAHSMKHANREQLSIDKRPLRILVADDETMVRRGLRRMLELNQTKVIDVGDGVAAIEAANESPEPFDIALLDVMMPRKTGYDVLTELRTRNLPTKIILMSGFHNINELANANTTNYQADAMLQKPFAWDELQLTVQRVMQRDLSSFPDKR